MMATILTHPLQMTLALVALRYGLGEIFRGIALLKPAHRLVVRPARQLQAA